MTTPEGKVKDKVKALLRLYSAYYFMPVQTGYGASSLDFLVCAGGHFIAIETKAPGKAVTQRQHLIIEQMRASGAAVFIIDGTDCRDYKELEATLKFYEMRRP